VRTHVNTTTQSTRNLQTNDTSEQAYLSRTGWLVPLATSRTLIHCMASFRHYDLYDHNRSFVYSFIFVARYCSRPERNKLVILYNTTQVRISTSCLPCETKLQETNISALLLFQAGILLSFTHTLHIHVSPGIITLTNLFLHV